MPHRRRPYPPAKHVKVPSGFAFNNEYGAHYFLYVTYWTCLLESAYLSLAFLAALFPRHRALYRTTWALRSIVAPAACLVALLYWTLIYPATGVTDYVVRASILEAVAWLQCESSFLVHDQTITPNTD